MMPKGNIFQKIKKINEITRAIRADTENLGVNAAFRVLPSEEQISEFCRSARDLKKVAEGMKKLQKASTRLVAARESAGENPRSGRPGRKKPISYTLNKAAMGLNASIVTGSFKPKGFRDMGRRKDV